MFAKAAGQVLFEKKGPKQRTFVSVVLS
ncbi:MAG: hypothetical protein ACKVHQ_11625 [Gammaproteobacteria bacterium]